MGNVQWPGDKNEAGDLRYTFQCTNGECEPGRAKFTAVYDEPGPEFVPSGMSCPYCHNPSLWVMEWAPNVNVVGTAGGHANPFYSPARAASEHRWMEDQIGEARRSCEGQDQLDGIAASPYGKWELNPDVASDRPGVGTQDDDDLAARRRIMDERNKALAEAAEKKIKGVSEKHVGRRHDG